MNISLSSTPTQVFDAVRERISAHIAVTNNATVACTLWDAHTHRLDAFRTTPRLCFTSPVPGCGKTVAQEVNVLLVQKGIRLGSTTEAALFRTIDAKHPTIFVDEMDALSKDAAEALRGVINNGHSKGAYVARCNVKNGNEPEVFEPFGALCLARIGIQPATIASRSITVHLKKRLPSQQVERLTDAGVAELRKLGNALAKVMEKLTLPDDVEFPDGLDDRQRDVWRPLLIVAAAVGGDWPRLAAAAASKFCTGVSEPAENIHLLGDLRTVFNNTVALHTNEILRRLARLDHGDWEHLTDKRLARILKPFGIFPTQIKIGGNNLRGYERVALSDAWERYAVAVPKAN